MKDFFCPACKKCGLHPYDKEGSRPDKTDDIHYMWCLYCGYKVLSARNKDLTKEKKK